MNLAMMDDIKRIRIRHNYGSKIDMMVRHLLYIRQHDGAKSVIFTQWKDAMHAIAKALEANGVSYRSLEDKNGLDRFKNDDSVSFQRDYTR